MFGEQIGWIGPELIKDKEADFFRRVVHVRHKFRRYFHSGEMARPPKLVGDMPRVKADWQWSGEWPVTTDAVLTGAWRLPKEKRLVLFFANVSEQPVPATMRLDASLYGIPTKKLRCRVINEEVNKPETRALTSPFEQRIEFKPRSVQAWEFGW
jgi:hypothetical protein